MEAVAMNATRIEWGVASLPLKGNTESGDSYLVRHFAGGALTAVIDGLGHGGEAAEAARAAMSMLEEHPSDSVIFLLQDCNHRLQGAPRGVVMTLVSFDFTENNMTCAGVGNVDGVLIRAATSSGPSVPHAQESILPRRGLVGERLPQLHAASHALFPGDTVVLATDGIRTGYTAEVHSVRKPSEIADAILKNHSSGTDDALVLVVRYLALDQESRP
jgi:negative regulator of sigma-B (phosphoserine phosphatase)